MAECYFIACMYYVLFIHSSIDGHLGFFHFLAIMNNAAVNILHEFLCGGSRTRSRVAGSHVTLGLTFQDLPGCFPER